MRYESRQYTSHQIALLHLKCISFWAMLTEINTGVKFRLQKGKQPWLAGHRRSAVVQELGRIFEQNKPLPTDDI
jgi:hypothetical protein